MYLIEKIRDIYNYYRLTDAQFKKQDKNFKKIVNKYTKELKSENIVLVDSFTGIESKLK